MRSTVRAQREIHVGSFSPMPPPDSELGQWFATHVQPHEPVLRAWLRSRFRTEDASDGPLRESSLGLLRDRERGEVTSPKAFLFAVARHLALDRCRHREATERRPQHVGRLHSPCVVLPRTAPC